MKKWLPVIDPDACTGCVACVDACTPGSLEMQDAVAVLTNLETCASDEHCLLACATDAIRMEWTAVKADPAIGRWQEHTVGGKA